MKMRIARGCCAALAAVALLMPTAAAAQSQRGSRIFNGSGNHGGRGYGRHYSGYGSHGHSGSRSSFSFWIGPGWSPWWWVPWGYSAPYYRPYAYPNPYYGYPYQYSEPPVAQPPVYEEQVPDAQPGESVWYYCPDPPGYYPYVRQCPKGWTKVAPGPESATPPVEEQQDSPTPDVGDPVPYEYRWYYCQDPPGYYPYVRECPKGWTMVAPSPAPAR